MILFRYLFKNIMGTLLAVMSILLLIVVSGRFVKYLADAASGELDPNILFSIILFRLPSFLELIIPLSFFIAILLAYGRLYADSEMTVMSACGVTTKRLAFYTLIPSFLVALVVGWITLWVSPSGIDKVQKIFEDTKATSGVQALVEGRFRVDKLSGRVTYTERVERDSGTMYNLFIADHSDRISGDREVSVTIAESGWVDASRDDGSRFMVLKEGVRYVGAPGEGGFQATQFAEFGQRMKVRENIYYQRTDARPTSQLFGTWYAKDKATLQWRLSLPLLVPIIALLALALSRTDPRRGRYAKLLPAFLIFMAYLMLLNVAREAVGKETLSPMIGLWWVHGVFFVLALALLGGRHFWLNLKRSLLGARHA